MTIHHLWFASVNNISRFFKCVNYKHEKCLQPCFTFQLSGTSFGSLNYMQTPITSEKRSWNSEVLQKSYQIVHISWLYIELFGLKSLILQFGLKSRRLDVLHPHLLWPKFNLERLWMRGILSCVIDARNLTNNYQWSNYNQLWACGKHTDRSTRSATIVCKISLNIFENHLKHIYLNCS